jgi:hypothetical protein
VSTRRAAPIVVALAAVAAVLVPYLALGGASYEPTPAADPCRTRAWRNPGNTEQTLEQIVLSALDGAACTMHVSREDLVIALADESSLDRFTREHGISRARADRAVRNGLVRAVDDAERAGALSGFVGGLVRSAVERIPPRLVLELLQQLRGLVGAAP